jgi:hypothetical protein
MPALLAGSLTEMKKGGKMFKKAFLTVLVVALGVIAFGIAHADQIDAMRTNSGPSLPATQDVYVNPGGLGDSLIYGYYNVRDNRDNYFNVVNTDTSNGVRARIRFKEAADVDVCGGSVEILDFDICLTPGDVWTGVIKNVNGLGTLFSPDDDTYVDVGQTRGLKSVIFPTEFPNGVAFKDSSAGNTGVSADDTLEGYFLVIGMNELTSISALLNCGDQGDVLSEVDNVLFGVNYAVDMDNLATNAYNATALGDFSPIAFIQNLADEGPNLNNSQAGNSIRPVNYALTKSNVYSIYDLESDIAGKTSMIVNFPTRRETCQEPLNLFDDDRVLITVWDDEEQSPVTVCEFSPCPQGVDNNLPFEVNVIDLNNSDIFSSSVEVPLSILFEYGWINIDFTRANTTPISPEHSTTMAGTHTSLGLPAIGYVAMDIANGKSTHMLPLQYSAEITLD